MAGDNHASGQAMAIKIRLAHLAKKHRTPPSVRHVEPDLPECDGAMILSGIAASTNIDLERMKFRKYSLSWLPWRLPELRYRRRCWHSRLVGRD
jgi:hypothetical protein